MTAPVPADSLDQARNKYRLIAQYLRLTEAQAEQIEADNYDSLLMLITEKQSIIEQVNCLEREGGDAGAADLQVSQVMSATQALLGLAREIETCNMAAIRKNQARILAQLKEVQLQKATHAAYRGRHASMEGILIDKKN